MSPSRIAAMGPPSAASGDTWPIIRPRVAPLKRPSVSSATESPKPSPTIAPVTASISRVPGPPFGPSLRITTTSPAFTRLAFTAAMASSSDSKTRAGPRWLSRSCPLIFATHPSGDRFPRRITSPPVALSGLSRGAITSWSGVSTAIDASSPMVFPVTVRADSFSFLPRSSRFASSRIPPARCMSAATNRPNGFKSQSRGVRSLIF